MDKMTCYPEDYAKLFIPTFNYLYKSNVRFFSDKESPVRKYWRFLYIFPCITLLYVTCLIHIFDVMSQKEIFKVAYLMPPFLVCTQAILKASVLLKNTSKLTEIIRELGGLWRTSGTTKTQNEKRALILKKVNFCNLVLYWISIFGTVQYLTSPGLETIYRKFVLKEDSELLLPLSCSYPLTASDNWLIYICIYIFQFYTMFLFVFVYVGGELIMITLCATLGIEFTLLQEDLLNLNPVTSKKRNGSESDRNNSQKILREFIKRHQELIELSRKLDEVFNFMIFIDLLFVGITTCFFRYAGQFSRGPTYMLNNYIAVFSSMLPVLYLCYYGELLTGASAGIGDIAYQTLWYNAGTHYQKTIWLIIKRSQRPCCLTSLRYAPITLHMFTKVMSTTWSYFSLMNTVYGNES